MADPYLGDIRMFGGTFAPQGWLFCDGSLLPINQYDALFALIGITYGGDGQTNFAIPNLLGRVPVHANGSSYPLGVSAGSEQVTLTTQQIPSHNHPLAATTGTAATGSPAGALLAAGQTMYRATTSAPGDHMSSSAVGPAGGSAPHPNVMPYQAVNYIIAVEGVYPTQS